MPANVIKNMTVEIFDHTQVGKQLTVLTKKQGVKPVYQYAAQEGFKPLKGAKNMQGFKRTYNAAKPIKRGKEKVQRLEYSFHVQELQKRGSKDKAAIIVTHLRGVGLKGADVAEARLLVAPGGKIAKAREYKYDLKKKKVAATRSWWTRCKACLKKNCIATCVTSLVTCSGTWVAYLACVGAICGGCFTRCSACASCKCRWWCKWAAGCCK